MKKFLFALMGLVVAGNALGVCQLNKGCSGRGNDCLLSGSFMINNSGEGGVNADNKYENWAYVCEKGYCEAGDVVCSAGFDKCYECYVAKTSGMNFLGMGNDQWYAVPECENKSLNDRSNAHKVLWNSSFSRIERAVATGETSLSPTGQVCIKYVCNDNYKEVDGKCESEKKGACDLSGGTWNDTLNKCDCKGTVKNKNDYECNCTSGYAWNSDHSTGCHDVAAANAEKVCRDSGGQYQSGDCKCDVAKHLRTSNGACICESDDYERDSSSKACKLKPGVITQDMCKKISEAEWRTDQCVCTDANKTVDRSRYECVYPKGYEICKNVTGTQWLDGGCVCTDSNYRWDVNRCVETDDYVASQNTQKINDLVRQIDSKINNLGGKLKEWRNVDGSFNTARLASDSIAGVVLGTVGGVVTSSIIKKNQVEDGFEDIKCAIGGQSVASYGDQFSVGLQ